jgi:N4-gp56 family major capsid protein
MLSTTGTSADVYPVLFLGRDAYGIVALKGMFALTPMVVNPKPSDSDPLAQRGHVSWKSMQTAVILQDAWMVRLEVAAVA